MAMFKNKINLGGKDKVAVIINHKEGQAKGKETKEVDCLHHIHILDRSGSMGWEIDGLIENVKQTIDAMSANDYVSIVWFSGVGQFKTLIKGARKDDSLKKILDTIKSTIGCTCFSDPMKEVGEIIDELSPICPNFNVTLFTDGEPVVPWSDQEEERKVFAEIAKFKDKVIAINTIGYRNGYNRDFLVKIASESMYGMMVHSSKINEYMSIFSHNYERVADLVLESVEIKAPNADVLYLNTYSSKLTKDYMKMSMLEKKKNQFVILADNEFTFEYNGETYNSSDIKAETKQATVDNIAYGYAYELYYLGRRQEALDILAKSIGDKYLVDRQINAFTYDEVSAYSKQLRKAVFKNKFRWLDGKCSPDYLPADDALCVMDVLKTLVSGENYYVYSNNYNRIGRKTEDTFNLFKWDDKEHTTKLNELVFNENELNISIRSRITGTVQINPIQAKAVDLPAEIKSYVYRNQTLIKDGNLNMEQITAVVDKDTMDKIIWFGSQVDGLIESTEHRPGDKCKVTLNLNVLPIINRTYLGDNGNIKNIMTKTIKITELEARQKVVNSYIKELKAANPDLEKDKEFASYNDDQIEVLRQHGLDKSLMYAGVNNVTAEKNEDDYYMTRQLGFTLKGYASLPSLKDVEAKIKDNKKLNGPGQIMAAYIADLKARVALVVQTDEAFKLFYENELQAIKRQLLNERIEINSMKIAKILTGDWFDNLVADDKGNYNYVEGDNTLVVKTAKVKKYF
jgi:hypothetical protein